MVDVTESPIERPVHQQKQFYSGKKKQHTFKSQLVRDKIRKNKTGFYKNFDYPPDQSRGLKPVLFFYSSFKVINLSTRTIVCTAHGKGRRHDFWLFQASKVRFHIQTEGLADKGYQGIHKFHLNSQIPKKKPRKGQTSSADKHLNREERQAPSASRACQSFLKDFQDSL